MSSKQWGVYNHRISDASHPLMRGINTRFDAPHSRFNDISRQLMEEAGLTVLAENSEVGVLMAVSPDQFRGVYFQGHPEYDAVSLLKEYKREVNRYLNDELDSPPLCPANYFSEHAMAIVAKHIAACEKSKKDDSAAPAFPEDDLVQLVDNTWGDTGKAIVNNWLGLVYQLTNLDRRQQYMQGVDRDDPLGYIRQDRQSIS